VNQDVTMVGQEGPFPADFGGFHEFSIAVV